MRSTKLRVVHNDTLLTRAIGSGFCMQSCLVNYTVDLRLYQVHSSGQFHIDCNNAVLEEKLQCRSVKQNDVQHT